MRQSCTAQGKEMDRIERVWLMTNDIQPQPKLLDGIVGTRMLRVSQNNLEKWLPRRRGHHDLRPHLFDRPTGNLMMRFRKMRDANKVKKDLSKL